MSRLPGSRTKASVYVAPYNRPVRSTNTRHPKNVWNNILEKPNLSTEDYYKWAEQNPAMAQAIEWFAPLAGIQRTDDWGEIRLEKIDNDCLFWMYMSELRKEYKIQKRVFDGRRGSFWHNRGTLLGAYKRGNLYTLSVTETDSMFKRRDGADPVFLKNSAPLHYLPVLLSVSDYNEKEAYILWVARRARRMGFGSLILKLAKINSVGEILGSPIAQAFWKSQTHIARK